MSHRPSMSDLRSQARVLVEDYLASDLKNDEVRYKVVDDGLWTLQVIPDWTQDTGVTVNLIANINGSKVLIGELTDL